MQRASWWFVSAAFVLGACTPTTTATAAPIRAPGSQAPRVTEQTDLIPPSTTPNREDERVIAEIKAGDYRFELVAIQTSGDPPPTATVLLRASDLDGGIVSEIIIEQPGSFFWYVVTGPEPACTFRAETTGEDIQVDVQLLLSPSLGCSTSYAYLLHEGSLDPQ